MFIKISILITNMYMPQIYQQQNDFSRITLLYLIYCVVISLWFLFLYGKFLYELKCARIYIYIYIYIYIIQAHIYAQKYNIILYMH